MKAEEFLNNSEFSPSSFEGEELYIEKEDVLELMERYKSAAVNAKLQEAKLEIKENTKRVLSTEDYREWEGGYETATIDAEIIIDKMCDFK